MGDYEDDEWGNPYHQPPRDRNNPYARRQYDEDKKKALAAKSKILSAEKGRAFTSQTKKSFPESSVESKKPISSTPSTLEKSGTEIDAKTRVYVVGGASDNRQEVNGVAYFKDESNMFEKPKFYREIRTVIKAVEEISEDEWYLENGIEENTPPF